MSHSRPHFWPRFSRRIWHFFSVKNSMPCVGLVVLAGCLTFVIAPDDEPAPGRISEALGRLPTIVIDAGHGGRDDGAQANGFVEKNLTLDVAKRLAEVLKSFGFPTKMTRTDDTHVSLEERADLANRIDHSIFVSIHFNQSSASEASGVETFYAREKVLPENAWTWVGFFSSPEPPALDNGEELAAFIQTALVDRTSSTNRGIGSRALYVVRHVRAPAVLVEGGFLSNVFDARLLSAPAYRDRLASAIAEGIMRFEKAKPRDDRPTRLARVSP